jgi:predicted transcriptional regulator of viral defense system
VNDCSKKEGKPMIFNYKDCIEHYGTDYKIKQALAEKTLFQKEKGLYSDKEFCSELELIVAKYPRAVFTGESAFYYYGFTDVIPTHYFMATRREDTRIKDKRVEQAFVKDSLYDFDKVTIEYQNVEISIYSRERLLVDLIRFKSKVPFEYYKEIICAYRKIVNELDFFKIKDYAAMLKRGDKILDIIQLEVL